MGGVQQGLEVGRDEPFPLTPALVVGDRAVDQPNAAAGLDADQGGDRDPAPITVGDLQRRGLALAGPGPSSGRSQALALARFS